MQYQQVRKIIASKTYRETQFVQDQLKLKSFIAAINKMPIDTQAFKIIRILLKFYQFPIIILMRPFYQRIEKQNNMKYVEIFEEDLKTVGSIVKKILGKSEFPCLQIFFASGFNSEYLKQLNLDASVNMVSFMSQVEKIDKKISEISIDSNEYSTHQIMVDIQTILRKKNIQVIEKICIEAYKSILEQKIKLIEQNKPIPRRIFQKNYDTIEIERGIKIEDIKAAQQYLCCRTFFYNNQIIRQAETSTIEFKNYQFPYNSFLNNVLLKTICGFLNGQGGMIYIGIRQSVEFKKRVIVGQTISEYQKEQILTHYRYLSQRIQPQIISNSLCKLEFVPVKQSTKYYNYIAGKNIIRIRIQKGNHKCLYSFRLYGEDSQKIAIRTQNEVLSYKIGQKVLQIYRNKLTLGEQLPYKLHEGACRQPQLGKSYYDHYYYRSQSLNYDEQKEQKWLQEAKKNQNNQNNQNNTVKYVDSTKTKGSKRKTDSIIKALVFKQKQWNSVKNFFDQSSEINDSSSWIIVVISQILKHNQGQLVSSHLYLDDNDNRQDFRQTLTDKKILHSCNNKDIFFSSAKDILEAYIILKNLGIVYKFITE